MPCRHVGYWKPQRQGHDLPELAAAITLIFDVRQLELMQQALE